MARVLLALATPVSLAAASGVLRAQDSSAVRLTPAGILVDFQDADIRAVITALSEAGRLNIIYGELPARRITVRLRQPVARADVLPLLRSLVQSNGLRLVEEGGLIRVEGGQGVPPAGGAGGAGGAPGGGAQGNTLLYVYRLRHARAARIAATLQQIFGGRAAAAATAAAPGISGPPLSEQLRRQQVAPVGDSVRLTIPGATVVGIPGSLRGEVQIVPDETTNSLLVRASGSDYDVIRQAIEAMDLRPLQVLIEVLIAEVQRTRDLDISLGAKSVRSGSGNVTTGELNTRGRVFGDSGAANNLLLRFSRGGRVTLDVAISALAARGDVRILSRPVVLAQNNQEARILVGSQRPFVQVSQALPTDVGSIRQVVQYRDVGTSLTILPTINPDGYVSLQVSQEVSSATAETQFGAPVISTREASTQLFVRDGQTAVLGGLVDRQRERSRSGIPVLSEIPLVGALFGGTRHADVNSELFLFLTPHIVRDDQDVDRLREGVEQRTDGVGAILEQNPSIAPPDHRPAAPRPSPPAPPAPAAPAPASVPRPRGTP